MKNLLTSDHGIFCLLLVAAATLLVAIGKLDSAAWVDFCKWIAVTLVSSGTVVAAVSTHYASKTPVPQATS